MSVILHRPDWFTKEKYLQLKKDRFTDRQIYEDLLFVSLKTFSRFKRELEVVGVNNQGGHNRIVNHQKARELYREGYSIRSIANRYGASYQTVFNVVKY